MPQPAKSIDPVMLTATRKYKELQEADGGLPSYLLTTVRNKIGWPTRWRPKIRFRRQSTTSAPRWTGALRVAMSSVQTELGSSSQAHRQAPTCRSPPHLPGDWPHAGPRLDRSSTYATTLSWLKRMCQTMRSVGTFS
ncbi:hypothetical protein GGE24_005535 [Bradyrhizobium centrosematis]|nr:hypothetical protein [Bradyrhizobium centrosematis]MCS3776179.1 hypothetical protein [Bradyrhizobium centrosematis]